MPLVLKLSYMSQLFSASTFVAKPESTEINVGIPIILNRLNLHSTF